MKMNYGATLSATLLVSALVFSGCGDGGYQTGDSNAAGDEALPLASGAADPTWPEKVPEGTLDFKTHVRPLLIINCLECHNREDAPRNGNFILETRALAMTTGSAPPAIIPGDPDKSPLITVMTLDPLHQRAMPPAPDKIWGVRLEILRRWIQQGAVWPEDVTLVHPREITTW
jgi:Planctomycete cytochrome C